MNEFFQRLKQRKLVQWTLAYVAAAFALLQGIDIVAQRFGWPEQTMRFVIIALSVGLFVTLVLAWYHGERGAQRVTGTELLILALLLAIGGGLLWRFVSIAREPTEQSGAARASAESKSEINAKSVAVLAFANLSDDKGQRIFFRWHQRGIADCAAKNSRSARCRADIGVFVQRQERHRAGNRSRNSAWRIWLREVCAKPATSCASRPASLRPTRAKSNGRKITRAI